MKRGGVEVEGGEEVVGGRRGHGDGTSNAAVNVVDVEVGGGAKGGAEGSAEGGNGGGLEHAVLVEDEGVGGRLDVATSRVAGVAVVLEVEVEGEGQ